MTTFRIYTAPNTNASAIGERLASATQSAWRNAVDNCDNTGEGRVFLDCDDNLAEIAMTELENDASVTAYDVL